MIDQILELPDSDVIHIFAKLSKRLNWTFPCELTQTAASSSDNEGIVEDILELSNDDALLIVRDVGFQRGLQIPNVPRVNTTTNVVNGVTVTFGGKCYHRASCEALSREWVLDKNKFVVEKEVAIKMGNYACPRCQPDTSPSSKSSQPS